MRADVYCLVFIGFVTVYDLTVYSASILPYIQSLVDSDDQASFILSIVISGTALVQLVFSISCGYLARKLTMKYVFLLFQSTGVLGILIYAFSGWPLRSAWGIVIGRALYGVNAACLGLILSYISTVVQDRTERAALIANYRGVTIFAALPSSLMSLILALPILEFNIGSYQFNAYTYPAWTSLILQAISMTLNVIYLQKVEGDNVQPAPSVSQSDGPRKNIFISPGVILILVIFFYDGYFLSVLAYTLPVVMLEGYQWTVVQYAPVWFGISIVGVATVLLTKSLAKRLGEYLYVVVVPALGYMSIMCVLMCIGAVGQGKLPTGIGETVFLFGAETGFGGFQIVQTSLSSIFSQIIPPEFIIRMMPMTSGLYAMGKIFGPIICEIQVEILGIGFVFYTLLVMTAILMFIVIILNKHLRNRDEVIHETEVILPTENDLLKKDDETNL